MLSAVLRDSSGVGLPVLLVATGNSFLHFYNQGTRIFSLLLPSKVNAVTEGVALTLVSCAKELQAPPKRHPS